MNFTAFNNYDSTLWFAEKVPTVICDGWRYIVGFAALLLIWQSWPKRKSATAATGESSQIPESPEPEARVRRRSRSSKG